MARLEINLLGSFQVSLDGKPVSGFDSDKVRGLLAYLAVEADQPHRRERLAGLLWPDYPERSARTSLRSALANLRKVTGDQQAQPPFLLITNRTIQFNLASDSQLDVHQFAALVGGEPGRSTDTSQLESAVALYQGEFLEGFFIPDSSAFEEWAQVTRQSFQWQMLSALHRLAAHHLEEEAFEQALHYAQRQIELDSFQEAAHQQVMSILAKSGQRNEALRHYDEYRQQLKAELGVEPLKTTQAMYQRLLQGELPQGTLTFLFTDIEGSTHLLSQLRDRYAELLADQRRILRETFTKHQGREVDTQGDAFFVAFPRATEAVAAVVEVQRALAKHQWPGAVEVRVRMGLHTGEPWLVEEGYAGMAVHRAARIAHIGHGGQVLLSETTAPLVQDELPEGVRLLDLGRHHLKDLHRPEHIHQLVIEGLPAEFPPLKSMEVLPPEILMDMGEIKLPAFLEDETKETPAPLFVGRERELAQLDVLLKRALAGEGGMAFITGGPGRGKTALMDAFSRRAMEAYPDLLVTAGSCSAYTGVGDPFLPFRDVLSMLTGDIKTRWTTGAISHENTVRLWKTMPYAAQALVKVGRDLVGGFVSGRALAERLSTAFPGTQTITRDLDMLDKGRRAAPGDLEQRALFEQYLQVLYQITQEHPLLLTLDDLQWADSTSINLLFHLGRRLKGGRILLIGAYRPEEVALERADERHPLQAVLDEFKRLFGEIWIDLSKTTESEGRYFVDTFLDSEPNRLPKTFRNTLYQHTAGHPLFTLELFRDLQERRAIVKDPKDYWVEGPSLDWKRLPARVEGVFDGRIGRLDQELQNLLVWAAVEGEQFSVQVLASVLKQGEHQIIERLVDELCDRHRLVEEIGTVNIAGGRVYLYKFKHVLIQQYLYNNLTPVKREVLHAEVGQTLEAIYDSCLEEVAIKLVWHFELAKNDQKVMKYALLAGDRARQMGASHEAIKFYSTALVKAQDLKRVDLPIKLDQIHEKLGDVYLKNLSKNSQALKHYHKFLSLTKRWDEKMRGERKIAAIYLLEGDLKEAKKYYQSALRRLDGEALVTEASLVHGGLVYVYIYQNQLEEAEKHANAALSISTRLDDNNGMAYAHNARGHIAVYRNDLENAYQHFTSSLALYQAIGDLPRTAKLCNNLGETARLLGKMETAQSFLSEGLSIARRVGDKRDEAAVLSTSADLYMDQGRWEEAVKVLTDVLPIAKESGVTVRIIEANWFLGTAYHKAGHLEQARHNLEFAEQLCLNTEYVRYLPKIYLELARLEVYLGNYKDARRDIQLASDMAGDEPGDEFYGQLERSYGYLSSHQQDWVVATTHYEKALEYIQKTSNPVKTAQVRYELGESYINRIQEGDRERALENLLVARSVFQQISATYYLNLVEAQLDKLEIRQSTPGS